MRILFSSDLHGKINLYEELLALAQKHAIQCLLIGGDLFPTKLGGIGKLITGYADFSPGLEVQIDFINSYLAPALNSFIRQNPQKKIFYIPGNHDWVTAIQHLEHMVPDADNIHLRNTLFNDFYFLGYGSVTDSTFWVKDYVRRDLPNDGYMPSRFACISTEDGIQPVDDGSYIFRYPSITQELAAVTTPDPVKTICLFHCPPFDTGLDTLHNCKPIGSRGIKTFIETRQPLITLHGHIHESPYKSGQYHTRIGNTLSINAGHAHDHLHAVLFNTENPAGTLIHTIFGTGSPQNNENILDRCTLKLKAFVMKNILTK